MFQLIISVTASSLILPVVYLVTPLVSPCSARACQYLSSIPFLLNGVWAFLVTQHPRSFCLPPTDMVFTIWAMGGSGSKEQRQVGVLAAVISPVRLVASPITGVRPLPWQGEKGNLALGFARLGTQRGRKLDNSYF